MNPCPAPCGIGTQCVVVNHSPICSCQPGYSGDPFTRCAPIPRKKHYEIEFEFIILNPVTEQRLVINLPFTAQLDIQTIKPDPCVPSPCGSFSQCRDIGGVPACTCSQNYIGQPPNCRPECTINSECPSSMACINEKCRDPCPGSCGFGARCMTTNHIPVCNCPEGYTGNPFENCKLQDICKHFQNFLIKSVSTELQIFSIALFSLKQHLKENQLISAYEPNPMQNDRCNPSPCGANAQCNDGECTCLPEFQGNPYAGCRPECVLNSDCPRDKACLRNKCENPCGGACAINALCNVVNHVPMCSCPPNMSGNPFSQCLVIQGTSFKNLTKLLHHHL